MSNIYIQEPPTNGKVLLKTTVGDIDIELWAKETPKACRNFVQLCLEGYYDGTIFHRVVKGFIAQGGDPTGTGMGGESIYGKPFKDEFHTRLRFVRRGLVACASGGKDDNASQFFFTLGASPDLQNKHTIFGKVTGNTLYNMLKLEEVMVDENDRPLYPHKIISTEVLTNPFPDIIPRVIKKEPKQEEDKKDKKAKGTKNFKLLSFGEEAEEEEEAVNAVVKEYRGKSKSSHDLAKDPKLSSVPVVDPDELKKRNYDDDDERCDEEVLGRIQKKLKKDPAEPNKKLETKEADENEGVESIQDERKRASAQKIEEIRREIRKIKREINEEKKIKEQHEQQLAAEARAEAKKVEENSMLAAFHEEQRRYSEKKQKQPKKGSSREAQTLALLAKFQSRIESAREKHVEELESQEVSSGEEEDCNEKWLLHKLQFEAQGPTLAKDANIKAEEMYDISDPRHPLNQRRREASKKAASRLNK